MGPGIGRGARATSTRHAPNADTEADLWFNALLVRGHGPEGFVFLPKVAHRLQVHLKDSGFLQHSLSAFEPHQHALPLELEWQARLTRSLLAGRDDDVERLQLELLAALRATNELPLARAVGSWLLRDVHPAMPELRRFPLTLVSELAAGVVTTVGQPLLRSANPSELARVAHYDVASWLPTARLMLRREAGLLTMARELKDPTHVLDLPVTNPFVLRVKTQDGTDVEQLLQYSSGRSARFVHVSVKPLELRDVVGRVFRLDERPPSPLQPPQPGTGGELHSPSTDAIVGREADLEQLRAWLAGPEAVRVIVGPVGRGKRRLSDELARGFRGARFVGHLQDTAGLPALLLKLAEFLGVTGPWALPDAVASTTSATLIVLQGLHEDDFQNESLSALIAALRSQSIVKLLMTGEAPSGLETHELERLSADAIDTIVREVVSSAAVRQRLSRASGGEPLLGQLLRSIARDLGSDAADEIAASLDAAADVSTNVRRLVEAVMRRSPTHYMELIGELSTAEPVNEALQALYEPLQSPDPDLAPLVKWCNKYKDHHVRQTVLAALDATGRLPSEELLPLLDRLGAWAPSDEMIRNWELWPALGNVLSAVLKRRDAATTGILEDLLRRELAGWRQEQIVLIAIPKSGLADEGNPLAIDLIRRLWVHTTARQDAHRQGAWTLAKDVNSANEAREALALFGQVDDWARARLVLSLMQLPPIEKEQLGLIELDSDASAFLLDPVNAYFVSLLRLWAWHPLHRQFDLGTVFRLPDVVPTPETLAERLGLTAHHLFHRQPELLVLPIADETQMAAAVHDVIGQYLRGTVSANDILVFADLVALQIEVRIDTVGRSLNRYDLFDAFVSEALIAAGARALEIVRILAKCLDEGHRWAVAQRFKPTYTKAAAGSRGEQRMPCLYELVTPDDYWTAAKLMASDDHEWVVRDTLRGIAEFWPSRSPTGVDEAGAGALAEPALDWFETNEHRGGEQTHDVHFYIDSLRAVCRPFADSWDKLTRQAPNDSGHPYS